MPELITIKMKPSDVVIIDEDYGGNKTGHCIACGASGWIEGFGYPNRVKNSLGNHLQHKKGCPMNRVLGDDGRLRNK